MLGQSIRRLREQAGFTSQELAEMANVSQPYISQIENDHRQPGYNTLLAIATALNVPIEHFVTSDKTIHYPVGIISHSQSAATGSSLTHESHSQYYSNEHSAQSNQTTPRPGRCSLSLDALVDYALAIENARRSQISPEELYEAVEALKRLKRIRDKR